MGLRRYERAVGKAVLPPFPRKQQRTRFPTATLGFTAGNRRLFPAGERKLVAAKSGSSGLFGQARRWHWRLVLLSANSQVAEQQQPDKHCPNADKERAHRRFEPKLNGVRAGLQIDAPHDVIAA